MNNEIIAKKQFTSWTFKKLEQRTRIMALNSSFYHVFGISYKFKSEEVDGKLKYICQEFPTMIRYEFDCKRDLSAYMFNVIPKIRKSCKICSLNYFNIDKNILKNIYKGIRKHYDDEQNKYVEVVSNTTEDYCHNCIKWLELPSYEMTILPENIKQKIISDIWPMIDAYLKGNFECKDCGDFVYRETLKKGHTMFSVNSEGEFHPHGFCWACYKRN